MFELYRPSNATNRTSPYVIYPSCLFCLDLGYALWYPEPHKTGEPQIGDVGYMKEGAFIRLFNINTSQPEHQVTFWKRPFETTEPLDDSENLFLLDTRDRAISDGPHLSRGVRQRETRGSVTISASAEAAATLKAGYTCKETQGALLVLQSHGHSETVFSNRKLKIYMVRQHEQWCAYLRDVLGQDISSGEVVLISGWVKTSADWAAAAFSNFVSKHHAAIQAQASQFVGFELFRSRMRAQSGPKMHRQGVKYPRGKGRTLAELERDQSIFLQRYKLKRRLVILKTIVAGAGYDRLPDHGRGGDSGERLHANREESDDSDADDDGLQWLQDKIVDPLDILLEYILEVSDAEVAIARDHDIRGILGFDDWPIDLATYLRRVQPPVDVEHQCGTISLAGLLARERARNIERRFVTAADLRRWPQINYEGAGIPSMAPAKFTDDPDLSLNFPSKWPYLEFPDPSASNDTLTITPFAASPDGKFLAAIAGTLHMVVWRLSDGLAVQRFGERGHTAPICSLAFSPDSRTLISGSADNTAIIWSVDNGRLISRLEGHRETVDRVIYTSDGSLVVTVSSNYSAIKFWDARSGMPLCTFQHRWRIDDLLLSLEGSKLAVPMDRGVALYEAGSRGPIVQLGIVNAPSSAKISSTALSPDGDRLFVSYNKGNSHIYSTDTCKMLLELDQFQLAGTITSAAFSPDGGKLAVAAAHSAVPIWDLSSGEMELHFPMDALATTIAFSPDGAFLAAAGGDAGSTTSVWGFSESEGLVAEFTAPASPIEYIKFLPDSRRLFTFMKGDKGPVCLWNVADVLRLL